MTTSKYIHTYYNSVKTWTMNGCFMWKQHLLKSSAARITEYKTLIKGV